MQKRGINWKRQTNGKEREVKDTDKGKMKEKLRERKKGKKKGKKCEGGKEK